MSENQNLTAVAPVAPKERAPVFVGMRGLEIKSLDDLWRVSGYISKSGLAPKGIESPEAIFVALELGLELGLPVMSALQNIAVINGRPGVFGDVQLALVRSSGMLEDYAEREIGDRKDDSWGVECTCKRLNSKFASSRFTVADAKRAGLWGKQGPWSQYPARMMKFRARGFLLRDEFGDVLKGVKSVEELRDMTEEERFERARNVTPVAPGEPPQPENAPLAPSTRSEPPTTVSHPVNPDEKAEADAGLAPAAKAQDKKPEPAQTAKARTAQDDLAQLCLDQKVNFDGFVKLAKASGWEAPWDDISSFSEIPDALCKSLIASKKLLTRVIAQFAKENPQ